MSKRLKLLLNIGSADATKLGLKKTKEGDTVSVSDDVAKILVEHGWATDEARDVPAPEARPGARQASNAPSGLNLPSDMKITGSAGSGGEVEEVDDADTSPVSDSNADEAIDQISRMRSRDNLQRIADTDKRVSVQKAARDRLGAL